MLARRLAFTVLVALLPALALSAAPAGAAPPVQIGTSGDYPQIAVGPDGVGHVAWVSRPDSKDVNYCRVAAGGTSCTAQVLAGEPLQAGGAGNLNIFAPSPGKVVIEADVTECAGATSALYGLEEWVSTDGGASFTHSCRTAATGSGVNVTRGKNLFDAAGDRFIAAGGSASGKSILATPAASGPITDRQQDGTHDIFTTSNFYDIALGAGGSGAQSYLVAAAYSQDNAKPGIVYSVFNQPFLPAANAAINASANWTRDIQLPGSEKTIDPPSVVSGPSGVFLVYQDESRILNDAVGVAKFSPNVADLSQSRFGTPLRVEGTAADTSQSLADAVEDQAGRIHIVWNSSGSIRYARSDDGGATFHTFGTILNSFSATQKDIGAGPSGAGWMVFTGENSTINLVPLVATRGTGDPGDGITTPVTTGVAGGGGSITFGVPSQCVNPGSSFKVTLSWKRVKKKGNVFVKVFRSDFYIGNTVVKIDRKAPFVQRLTVTAGAQRGSYITLRARAFMKVRHGKVPKKSVYAKIRICP